MKKSILIEGTYHKEHFRIFDQNCLDIISECSDILSLGQDHNIPSQYYIPKWIETIEYYNKIRNGEVSEPRKLYRVEENIQIDNKAVDGHLIDFLIFYYHALKINIMNTKKSILALINKNLLNRLEKGLLVKLLFHFDNNFEITETIIA